MLAAAGSCGSLLRLPAAVAGCGYITFACGVLPCANHLVSLPALCRRYARQHYTSRAPPSHREIQAALVQIGDKEPSFIGSK